MKKFLLALFVATMLPASLFASPLIKESPGKNFYTTSQVRFNIDTSTLSFVPVVAEFYGDYYNSATRFDFDVVQGQIFIDGVQQPYFYYQYDEGVGRKMPYICFYKYWPLAPYVREGNVECFVYDQNNGDMPTQSYLDIAEYSAGQPDISVYGAQFDTKTVRPGENFTLNLTAKNTGNADAPIQTRTKFFWNKSSRIYSSQYDFGSALIPAMDVYEKVDRQYTFNVPADTAPGDYYFYIEFDGDHELTESNEVNNKLWAIITVDSPISGCTDPNAGNYSPSATIDDGSCTADEMNLYWVDMYKKVSNPLNTYYEAWGAEQVVSFRDVIHASLEVANSGTANVTTPSFLVSFYVNPASADSTIRYSANKIDTVVVGGLAPGNSTYVDVDYQMPAIVAGDYVLSWRIDAMDQVRETIELDNKSYVILRQEGEITAPIEGCTDSEAMNYNPDATINNDTCQYPSSPTTGEAHPNFKSFVGGTNLWNSIYQYYHIVNTPLNWGVVFSAQNFNNASGIPYVYYEVTDETTGEIFYPFTVGGRAISCSNGVDYSCVNTENAGNGVNILNGATVGHTYKVAFLNEDRTRNFYFSTNVIAALIEGCTDSNAVNYDVNAVIDDSSCRFPIYGCNDPDAVNYNPEVTDSDDSCQYSLPEDVSAGFNIANGYTVSSRKDFTVNFWFSAESIGWDVEEVRFFKDRQQQLYKSKKMFSEDQEDQRGISIWDSYMTPGEYVPRMCLVNSTESKTLCFFADGKQSLSGAKAVTVVADGGVVGCINPSADNFDPLATVSDGSCAFSSASSEFLDRKFLSKYNGSTEIEVDFSRERLDGKWFDNGKFPDFGARPSVDYDLFLCYTQLNEINETVPEECTKLQEWEYSTLDGKLTMTLSSAIQGISTTCSNEDFFRRVKVQHVQNDMDRVEVNFFNAWQNMVSVPALYCTVTDGVPQFDGGDFGSSSVSKTGIYALVDNLNLDLPDDTPPLFRSFVNGGEILGVKIPGAMGLLKAVLWLAAFVFKLFDIIPIVGDLSMAIAPPEGVLLSPPSNFFGLDFSQGQAINYVHYGAWGSVLTMWIDRMVMATLFIGFMRFLFRKFLSR